MVQSLNSSDIRRSVLTLPYSSTADHNTLLNNTFLVELKPLTKNSLKITKKLWKQLNYRT